MILQAKDLHKSFRQGLTKIEVLKGLNLEVEDGETVAVLGRSGAGKSTLLNLLSGLDRPSKGEMVLIDKAIHALSEKELTLFRARHMGIIFQQFHLLPHLNALENVSLPMEILGQPNAIERAEELLGKVGLSERSKHLPTQLSGGENQRVAVARALASSPDIILADEPSGSLDEDTGEEIMGLIFSLIEEEKRAMILVTHDEELAKKCSRQVRLDGGILSEVTL